MSGEAQGLERFLLKAATTLLAAERREEDESFNLFTVLRSGSDEVNLHSRFLHALLDHGTQGRRENLQAFLKLECLHLGNVASLNVDAAEVHREKAIEGERIDLWIADRPSGCAVAVENKIYAGDQPNQLERYYCALKRANFHDVRIIYLTLDGHEPSRNSQGKIPDGQLSSVSYEDLLPWLAACHDRAQENPALRSSIVQYRQLVRELTGGGLGAKQMYEMKKIIRESGSLALARDLGKAANELFVDIVHELWGEIDAAVKERFKKQGISCGPPSATGLERRERIKRTFGLSRKRIPEWHGLYYRLGGEGGNTGLHPAPLLGIEINGGREFFLGIRCLREDGEGLTAVEGDYGAIQEAVGSDSRLAAHFERGNHPWWPCWRYVRPDSATLTFAHVARLGSRDEQKLLAKEIANSLGGLWDALKDGPARERLR